MQIVSAGQILTLLAVFAAAAHARRCYVSHPPAEAGGAWSTAYETCHRGADFCFRGRLTTDGEAAVKEYFEWPVRAGQVLQACVESLEPPMEEMWSWYQVKSIRVCSVDGCNS